MEHRTRRFWAGGHFPAWAKMLTAVAVVLLFVLVFFRVRAFEVTGNVRYTAEEIAEASGITEGDILLGVSKTGTAGRLLTKLPYLEQVRISREMPGTIRISVVECSAAGLAVSEFSAGWLVSGKGKLLEEVEDTDEQNETGYPVIKGTCLLLPVAGDSAEFDDGERGRAALTLLGQIAAAGLSGSVSEIDVSDLENVTLQYEDRLEVWLGDGSDGDYRLRYLLAAASRLDADARGVLDLRFSGGDQAVFHPVG